MDMPDTAAAPARVEEWLARTAFAAADPTDAGCVIGRLCLAVFPRGSGIMKSSLARSVAIVIMARVLFGHGHRVRGTSDGPVGDIGSLGDIAALPTRGGDGRTTSALESDATSECVVLRDRRCDRATSAKVLGFGNTVTSDRRVALVRRKGGRRRRRMLAK